MHFSCSSDLPSRAMSSLSRSHRCNAQQFFHCKYILEPRTSEATNCHHQAANKSYYFPRNTMRDSIKDESNVMDLAIAHAIQESLVAYPSQSDLERFPDFDPTSASPLLLFSTLDYLPSPRRLDSDDMAQPIQHAPGTMTTSSYPPPDSATIKPERQRSSPPRDTHRRGYQACQPCRQR
jgi:hypothetical protein